MFWVTNDGYVSTRRATCADARRTSRLRFLFPTTLCQMATPSSRTTSPEERYLAACRSHTTVFSRTSQGSCGSLGPNFLQTFLGSSNNNEASVIAGARPKGQRSRSLPESGAIKVVTCLCCGNGRGGSGGILTVLLVEGVKRLFNACGWCAFKSHGRAVEEHIHPVWIEMPSCIRTEPVLRMQRMRTSELIL